MQCVMKGRYLHYVDNNLGKIEMRHKDRLNIIAWENLKWVCFGNIIVKTITIPVTLIMAWILSVIVNHATSGEVRKVVEYSLFLLALLLYRRYLIF